MISKIVLCFIIAVSFLGCTKSDAPSKTEPLAQNPVLPAQEPSPAQEPMLPAEEPMSPAQEAMSPVQDEQPAATQTLPLSLEAMQRGNNRFVKVTAIADDVTVNNMVFNRGNCQSTLFYYKYPIQMKFGSYFEAYTNGCDKIIEATANTNKGDFVYTFQ